MTLADVLPPRPRIKRKLSPWYVLRTQPQKEFAAETILRKLGVSVFVPSEPKYPRVKRGSRARNKNAQPKYYPFFTSYLFARFDDGIPWHRLERLHVITGVVGFDGQPLRLPEDEVEILLAMSGQSVPYRKAPSPHKAFQVGDEVEVMEGMFTGRTVPIVEIEGAFATFFTNFFGKRQKVKVPLSFLEAA
jgi:transcription antitermination factor NusG